ncbi:ABC transporter ATP-binding protein [Candidatus Acetothermia bacterium]|nr:ABC transporter ATP-binding protein [Candidatus Acetothermia bacterium]MBI3642596.1 ABC transporter ATP-binding protein [Candidatus Acetothermia bacterium]
MAVENLLQVEGVTKQFDGILAVSDASFEVNQGEIFGLLGPNGAGKTTLIRMIMGILRPDRGQISVMRNGMHAALQKERIGYLPEERGLYEDRRVGETLVYLAGLHDMDAGLAKERVLFWLNRFQLEGRYDSRLKELSKGTQQKIQFISAVLHQPEMVVLDEPFSGLDPPSQDLFRDLIRELSQSGMTVLLSSHQMNLVDRLCDRVFVIDNGQRVLYGDLDEIKREHGEDVIWIRYKEMDEPRLRAEFAAKGITRITQPGPQEIELLLPKGFSPNELLRLIDRHVDVEELTITKPSLHRVFVEIVERKR